MAKKPVILILLGLVIVLLLTWDDDDPQETFDLEAVYNSGYIEISFSDKSQDTQSAVLQILGMGEPFWKEFSGSEWVEYVPFQEPKYGWKAHPIILDIKHAELGHVQLKTEVYSTGDPIPRLVYSHP